MRIVIGIVVGLIVIVAIVFVAGLILPREHRATSRIALHQPPQEVWPVVRDLGSLVGTWPELKSAQRLPDQGGKEIWEQNAGGFPLKLIIDESAPPARLVTRIDAAPDATFGGVWTYQISPAAAGSTVTVTEEGYVNNPLFRTMMKVMGVHKTADGYLTALGRKFGETVKPEHVE
jgi:polyketide cyclase/dehydrase/lipid transport protein